jgi:hypothetical protein
MHLMNYYKLKVQDNLKLASAFVNSVEIDKYQKNAKKDKKKLRS